MTVWTLEKAIDYEGSDLLGVFSSREKAVEAMQQIIASEQRDPEWTEILLERVNGTRWEQDSVAFVVCEAEVR